MNFDLRLFAAYNLNTQLLVCPDTLYPDKSIKSSKLHLNQYRDDHGLFGGLLEDVPRLRSGPGLGAGAATVSTLFKPFFDILFLLGAQ